MVTSLIMSSGWLGEMGREKVNVFLEMTTTSGDTVNDKKKRSIWPLKWQIFC